MTAAPHVDRITGLLIGTAVGDSLGLPREGLSARRAARLYDGPLRQRFVFGRGMVSDDTDHTFLTAQALLATTRDVAGAVLEGDGVPAGRTGEAGPSESHPFGTRPDGPPVLR